MSWRNMLGVCIVTAGLLAGLATAEDKKPPAKPEKPQDVATEPPGGEDSNAMMEMWMKLAAPGEHHEHLKVLAGKWEVSGKMRMAPEAPWEESKSTIETEWILGGRFLVQRVKGEPMPPIETPFEGFALIGYDNGIQKYTAVWADNMGTMMMTAQGTCTADGKEITLEGAYENPMTKSKDPFKWVYRIKGPDEYVMEGRMNGPDGKEFVNLELTHKRAKG
ncbi:MAG: DUF1579 domain-containing protein [Phycisphaerae bacterium]